MAATDSAATREAKIRQAAKVLNVVADVTRLRLLLALSEREEIDVRELRGILNLSDNAITFHLAMLRHSGLVASRRVGMKTYYSVTEQGKAPIKVIRETMTLGLMPGE
jgi:ArsR family transcriptional regulator